MRVAIVPAILVTAMGCVSVDHVFPSWSSLDEETAEYYSSILRAAGEQALEPSEGVSVIRFTLIRSFENPLVVRVDCGNSCRLKAVQLSGASWPSRRSIIAERARVLTDMEREELTALIDRANIWGGPWADYRKPVVSDGAQWVIEAARDSNYVAWDVSSPYHDLRPFVDQRLSHYRRVGEYLILLTGLDVGSI